MKSKNKKSAILHPVKKNKDTGSMVKKSPVNGRVARARLSTAGTDDKKTEDLGWFFFSDL